jgi:hypothetical protein
MASMMQSQMGMVERQFVAAAEAMPDDKYSFAPGGAEFSGVRTFALVRFQLQMDWMSASC